MHFAFVSRVKQTTLVIAIGLATTLHASDLAPSRHAKINPRDRLTYIWIKPGSSLTGCDPDDKECIGWERPRRRIVIDKGFWIGQTEVTQGAFQHIMGSNPSRYRGSDRPVEQVDWFSAAAYCKRVGMRLPSESEWEYAALGGVQAPRYGDIDEIAWYDGNSGDMTHAVAQKQPNPYGLFDMLGNVWELVQDACTCGHHRRVMKGGSFYNISRNIRVPDRETPLDTLRHRNIGFRCVANSLP